jgi:hypothetical protein
MVLTVMLLKSLNSILLSNELVEKLSYYLSLKSIFQTTLLAILSHSWGEVLLFLFGVLKATEIYNCLSLRCKQGIDQCLQGYQR